MTKGHIDQHILNPYKGCFMLAGVFDGILGNLIWHLLVLALFPGILFIVSVMAFFHYLREEIEVVDAVTL